MGAQRIPLEDLSALRNLTTGQGCWVHGLGHTPGGIESVDEKQQRRPQLCDGQVTQLVGWQRYHRNCPANKINVFRGR